MGNERARNEVSCPPQVFNRELNAAGQVTLREAGGCIVAATLAGKLENGVVVTDFDTQRHCTKATGCLMLKAININAPKAKAA